MTNTNIWETALDRLHIKYHKHQLSNNAIFFCRLSNNLTFNMLINSEGVVRLWRFILSNMPNKKIGLHLTCSKPEYPGAIVGFEVTDECDLNCYAEQTIDTFDQDAENRIAKQLSGFSSLITGLNLRYQLKKE